MEKVKAGLRGLTAADKVVLAGAVYDSLLGNPHFPAPEPSLAELQAGRDDLSQAIVDAMDRGRAACARKSAAVARMDGLLSRLAAYVNSACAGDTVKLSTSGFNLAKQAEPLSTLDAPSDFGSKRPPYAGQVELYWKRVPGTLVYEVEIAIGPEGDQQQWRRLGLTSRPKFLVTGLEPNTTHSFRVCAVGTRTQGPYSGTLVARSAA